MSKCLIVLSGNLAFDLELREASRLLSSEPSVTTVGIQLHENESLLLPELDSCLNLEGAVIPVFDLVNQVEGTARVQEKYGFDSILIPANAWGRMFAPRLAMRLGVGLVADVTGLELVAGELQMIRPAYSGRLMAGIVKKGPGPRLMSIRQNAFVAGAAVSSVPRVGFPFSDRRPSGISFHGAREKTGGHDIRNSDVLVSGGGGVAEKFSRLNDLAQVLGGQVAASRRIVDDDVAPRRIQVGQSGKTVSPRLYVALGISGSVQHLEGLKKVPYLIAVNTDRDAPICSVADVVVIGDAIEFIDRFLERFAKHEIPGG